MPDPDATASPTPHASPPKPWPRRLYDTLSGFGLATILMLLLGVLTWLATLEQIDKGLYPTLNKYFHWKAPFLIPEINGKTVPLVLPGGYWVCALLLVNLTLGGIIRIRKGWKHYGNLIAHFGIILMLAGGGVAHHAEERGHMAIPEGGQSNTAEDYFEHVIEITEIIEGKPDTIHVIRGNYLTDLRGERIRTFRLPNLPFDLQVTGFLKNARPVSISDRAPRPGESHFDGYYLRELPPEVQTEVNAAACHVRILDRNGATPGDPFLLPAASFHPYTHRTLDGRIFTLELRKRLWPMPFTVRLDDFIARFHPGTSKPAEFISHVTRVENNAEAKVTIQMNEPMRYEGLTFFQASYRTPAEGTQAPMESVFEVVRNPADKWPEYSLYIVAFGMAVTFLTKLAVFLGSLSRKP